MSLRTSATHGIDIASDPVHGLVISYNGADQPTATAVATLAAAMAQAPPIFSPIIAATGMTSAEFASFCGLLGDAFADSMFPST